VVELFVKQIDALAETLPLSMSAIQGAHDASREHLLKFLNEECKAIRQDDEKQTTYTIKPGQQLHFRRLEGRVHKTTLAKTLVPRGFLVSLISQFDAFLGSLIRQLFKIKPEILNSSANTLTFSQLSEFGSIEDAREYVIDKEVESVLRKNHSEQFDWLENKFGMPLRSGLTAWPEFIEVTERRNLFVHTNGVVSHQYLEVCKRHSCAIDPALCSGMTLSATRDYFESAHECIFEVGVKLSQVLWRKSAPDDLQRADASLVKVCYELLADGRNRLARILLDFATETLKKHGSKENRLILVVNRAQAYKWSGDEDTARKIVNAEDWSATSVKFQLAHAVLLDDTTTAVHIMKQIGTGEADITKDAYREWPLFKEIRKSEVFAAAFEGIFGEPLNTVTIEATGTPTTTKHPIN